MEADVVHTENNPETVQGQAAATTKKPILQRVMQRILGK
jgi:hypothetical protein